MLTIRQATLADAEQIATIHVECWQSAYKNIVTDAFLQNIRKADWISRRTKQLEANASNTFIAEENGRISGFIIVGKNRGVEKYEGEVYAIYISPNSFRKGIGKKLFTTGINHLKNIGFGSSIVWVLKDNPCKSFYISLGGKLTGEKEIKIGEQILIEEAYCWKKL